MPAFGAALVAALLLGAPFSLHAREPDAVFGSVALTTQLPGALQDPVYWVGTDRAVNGEMAYGLRARASLLSKGIGLRVDGCTLPGNGVFGRLVAEAHASFAAGGLGLGVLPDRAGGLVVRLPLWLQAGTPDLHLRLRYREGGAVVDARDLFAVTIGTQQAVASARVSADLGWSSTLVGSGPELTLAAGYSRFSGLLQVRQFGETVQGDRVWQVGLGLLYAFHVQLPGTYEPDETLEPVAEAEEPVIEVSPAAATLDQVLQPGTMFELAAKTNVRGAASQTSICMADEATQSGDDAWYHLNCSPELPSGSPPGWRSGCYVVRPEGIWRMPACPGEPRPAGVRAELLVPRDLAAVSNRFIDLGAISALPRTLRIGDQTVEATCTLRADDRVTETCYAPDFGLVWSAWYHPKRTGGDGTARGVRLVRVTRDLPVDAEAPHLRSLRDHSAACLFGATCAMFGQCSVIQGKCLARNRDDCAQASVCARWGQCTPTAGACTAASNGDCQKSADCRENGACTAEGGRCLAQGQDCQATAGCRLLGRCTPVAGRCRIASDGDCRNSLQCQREGLCHLSGGVCWANDDGDCAGSEACLTFGLCKAAGGRCTGDGAGGEEP